MRRYVKFLTSIIRSPQAIYKLNMIIFIYRWGNWNLDQLSELLNKIVSGKIRIWTQACLTPKHIIFSHSTILPSLESFTTWGFSQLTVLKFLDSGLLYILKTYWGLRKVFIYNIECKL